jgi:hypothetical protein
MCLKGDESSSIFYPRKRMATRCFDGTWLALTQKYQKRRGKIPVVILEKT